jgi:sugar lactone lactonase YvrE
MMKAQRKWLVTLSVWLVATLTLALLVISLFGCGGGKSSPLTSPSVSSPPEISPDQSIATARFFVDVKTRQVTVTPISGTNKTTKGRTIFTGTAINFVTSTLLDHPGNPGIKVIRVALVNRTNITIGQFPNGVVTGVRVLFSPINPVGSFSDLRPLVTVSTFAGTGSAGTTDGHVGSATFSHPSGVAVDSSGNLYVADYSGHRIRKIQGGFVSTLAGSGVAGYANGVGTSASFNAPFGIAFNPVDNSLVVAEYSGNRIRRVTLDGKVSLIAGTGTAGDADGAGDVAQFRNPTGVVVDSNGVIYVSESSGHRIRKIVFTGSDPTNPSHYTVSTLAGSGVAGFADGVGTAAKFNVPRGLAISADGTIYVADQGNYRIRRVSPTGEVVTIAGTGVSGVVDGSGDTARFSAPYGIVWVNGSLIVSEGVHVLRQVRLKEPNAAEGRASSWLVQTIAGSSGVSGSADGSGVDARFNTPRLLAADRSGNIYVADTYNHKIRKLTPNSGFFPVGLATGSTSTEPVQLANAEGVIPSSDFGANLPFITYDEVLPPDGVSSSKEWWFVVPEGVTAFEFTVRVETATPGLIPPSSATGAGSSLSLVRTFAGAAGFVGFANGMPSQARFNGISGIAADARGNIYLADTANHAIRIITASGIVGTIAGNVGAPESGDVDGLGSSARFNSPKGIAVTPDGLALYVADSGNHKIKRIETWFGADPTNPDNWTVSTIAGTGTAGKDDGTGNVATFNEPYGVTLDQAGNVYVTERSGNRVRRLQFKGGNPNLPTSWQVSLVAGDNSATNGASGDTDGTGNAARFNSPAGITVDLSGNLYVADSGNHRIRKIANPLGASGETVSTFAGSTQGYADGTGTSAQFNAPLGIAVDSAGYLYVADTGNNRIRQISPTGAVKTVAGNGTAGIVDGTGNQARFNSPRSVTIDPAGNLYVTDGANGEVVRIIQRIINTGNP